MVSYFNRDLEENRARNVVNKVSGTKLLQGDLAEAWREGDTDYRQRGDAVLDDRQDHRSRHRPAGRGQRAADRGHGSMDLPAAARRQLGIVGDPADLIAAKPTIAGRRQERRPLRFGAIHRNNVFPSGLMSDQTGSPASRLKKLEDKMPSLARMTARACFAVVAVALPALVATEPARAQSPNMTFFVTSTGIGNGANLGGLAGADNYCQTLAQAAGAGAKTWRAYLSTQPADDKPAVNARDRIGKGPWQNSKGVEIAKDVADLHGANNNLTKQTALTEKGDVNNGIGDKPNRHDVLTGSQPDGTAFAAGEDRTCKNWTSSTQGSAMLGHADRKGLRDDDASKSWNSSHPSRGPDGGCSQSDLRSTGGDGLLYCFAAN